MKLFSIYFTTAFPLRLFGPIFRIFGPAFLIPPLGLQSAIEGFLEVDQDLSIILNNILLMYKITLYRNRDKNTISVRHVVNNLIAREKIEGYIISLSPIVLISLLFIRINGAFLVS